MPTPPDTTPDEARRLTRLRRRLSQPARDQLDAIRAALPGAVVRVEYDPADDDKEAGHD